MVGSSQTDLPSVTDPRTWESTHCILSPIRPHGLGRAGSDAHPATSRPSSARSRSRVGRTDQICWLGQCVLGALSAPAVAGRFGLSNRKSTRHCRSPPAQKRRFHRCSKTLAFVDGNYLGIRVIVVAVSPNTVTFEDLSRRAGVTRDSLSNFLAGFTRLKSPAR